MQLSWDIHLHKLGHPRSCLEAVEYMLLLKWKSGETQFCLNFQHIPELVLSKSHISIYGLEVTSLYESVAEKNHGKERQLNNVSSYLLLLGEEDTAVSSEALQSTNWKKSGKMIHLTIQTNKQ